MAELAPIMQAPPVVHQDGVYFGLSEADYHADRALGSTDHKRILGNAVQWQAKRLGALMNDLGLGEEDKEDSAGKRFGSAVHTMVLDGPEEFEARYYLKAEKPEGMLATIADMREALGDRCDLPKSAALHDHKRLCRLNGLEDRLLDTWLEGQKEAALGREEISRKWAATIRVINSMLNAPREDFGGRSVRATVLSGGMPEVSVFWTEDDGSVRYKARFDYLHQRSVVDLKTYTAREDQEPIDAFAWAARNYGYDLQAAHYLEARDQIASLVSWEQVFGDVDPAWIKRVADYRGEQTWSWLTVQTAGLPEVDVLEFRATLVQAAASQQIAEARRKYLSYRDKFGDDQLWVAGRGFVQMDDMAFPQSITTRGAERWTSR